MEYFLSFFSPVRVYGRPHTLCFLWQLIAGSNLAGSLLPAPFYRWGSRELFFSVFEQSLSADIKATSWETEESVFLHLRTQNSDLSWSSEEPQTELLKK